eukprot:Nitzschia sp. Nitz4//scaffold59_size112058//97828//98844//NITZ4_004127-RA/size112058-processed-gene-0.224-mRNA-1//-1//CDS//3329555177//8053//frame0
MTTNATPVASRAALQESDGSPSMNVRTTVHSAIAGYAAGMTGVLLGHPLDSLKVWIQTQTHGQNQHLQSSSAQSSRSFLQKVRAYYSGVTGPLLTVGLVQSVNFAIYDATRRFLYYPDTISQTSSDDFDPNAYRTQDPLGNVAIAGFVSGAGLAILTSPLILIKTRQQVTGLGFREASLDALLCPHTKKWQLSATMAGIIPHLGAETLGRALYYAVYEYTKREWLTVKKEKNLGDELAIWERCVAAGGAGIACWAFIFPMDAVRNRLYASTRGGINVEEGHSNIFYSHWKSTIQTTRQMWLEGSLYRGFSLTVFRAGPVAAVVLPVYDAVLDYLSKNY